MSRARSALLLLAGLFLVSTATAFAAGIPVRGRVLDSSGAPLARAKVRLVPVAPAHAAGRLDLEGKEGPEAVASVESGSDGMFLLTAPEAGMWTVIAGGEGLVPRMRQVTPLLAELDLPAVRLERDAGLTVRVTGPDGKPVSGARVRTRASFRPGMRVDSWSPDLGQALTDAEGKAVLPRAPSGSVTVTAGAPGLLPAERKEIRTGTVELRLGAGQTVPVRVLGADGKPAAEVLISGEKPDWILGTTDANGALSLTVPARSPLDVKLLAADGRTLRALVHPFRTGEKPAPRELRLPAASEVTARVTSAADGRPLAGALVWSMDDPGGFRRTDGRGEARLPVPAESPLFAGAAAPGYIEDSTDPLGVGGSRRSLSFSLQPDLMLTGMVVEESGRPVAGAEITPSVADPPQSLPIRTRMRMFLGGALVRSGPDGRFRLGNLVEGVGYELRVTRPGFAPARVEAALPAAGRPATPLRIVLGRGRGAFGRVLGPDQRPISGAAVTLRTSLPSDPRQRFRMALEPESLDTFEAVTGAEGRFDLRNLPAGRYDLTAKGRGFAPLTIPNLEIPEEDRTTDLGTLVLAPGIALEGHIVDAQGRPVEGAALHLTEAADASFSFPGLREESEPQALSGLDGFFRIEDLRAGSSFDLTALRTGYAAGEVMGVQVPADPPVRVVLQAVGALSGRVVDPDGRPIGNASVHLEIRPRALRGFGGGMSFSGAPSFDQTDPDGNFRIADVPPGVAGLQARAPGWQSGSASDIELRAGEEKSGIEIVLSPAAVLEGRVLSSSGQPVPGAEVRIASEEGRMSMVFPAGADGDGHYLLDGIPPGQRTIEASHPDHGAVRRQVVLRPGENSQDLTLEGGNDVTGRVVDESGAPVAGARVSLRQPGSFRGSEAVSAADGGFRIASVKDGTYDLGAAKEGFAAAERVSVTVAGASTGGHELRLTRGGSIVGRISGVEVADLARVRIQAMGGRSMPPGGRVEADGSYRIDHLREGEWQVRAELPGTGLYAEGTVRLEPGASEARLDLEMKRGLELTGRVRRNGAPAAGQLVTLMGPQFANTNTDADGRFRFEALVAGTYQLRLSDRSSQSSHEETVELEADREITIDLQTGDVNGRVVDAAGGAPLEGAVVQLLSLEGGRPAGSARSDSRGLFVLRGAAEGSWLLRAQLDGYAPAESTVQVSRGAADEVELSLRATEGVTLQVASAAGAPPVTVFYNVLDGAGRKIADGTAPVGEEGRARLARVPPGRWDLLVYGEGSAATEIAVNAPGDAGRLILPQGCTLRVKVNALEDAPVPAKVSLTGAGGRPFRALGRMGEPATSWDLMRGTFIFSRLPPGTWEVQATAADGRTWRATATTAPGVEAEVVLE